MSQQDEFTYDKGLKDDYDGVIVDAFFGVDERGNTRLVLSKHADDGEDVEDYYPVGTDWASFDGGKTVEHPSKSRLRADTSIPELMSRAFESGAEDIIRERSTANDSLGPKTAAVWPGLKFHWEVVSKPFDFKDQKTGEQVQGTSNRSYPTKFLGVVEGDGATASTASSTGGDNSTAADPLDGVDAATATKLKILAQTKPYAEWVDEALTLTEVRDNGNLLSALSDEGFYNKLKG